MTTTRDTATTPLLMDTWKGAPRGVAAVTVYDALFARLADEAGADAVLVGDSLGPAVLGIPESEVTLAQMIHHAAAVRRGLRRAALILDVPQSAMRPRPSMAAVRIARAAAVVDATAVKIEGAGRRVRATIDAAMQTGLSVVGHLSRADGSDDALIDAAHALAEIGIAALVLVNVPAAVAGQITRSIPAATLGMRSGDACDGSIVNALEVVGLLAPPGAAAEVGSVASDTPLARLSAFCATAHRARLTLVR